MKQEHTVEPLNNCFSELQQQAYAQGLDLEKAHRGCVESRREQVRLQGGLVMKENAHRATRTPLQAELKGAPKPLAMTPVGGKGSLGQSTGDGAEEM